MNITLHKDGTKKQLSRLFDSRDSTDQETAQDQE